MASGNRNINFTERELEVIHLLFEELTTEEIAERTFLSPRTIHGHRGRILEKTKARNVIGIIKYAVKNGILKF